MVSCSALASSAREGPFSRGRTKRCWPFASTAAWAAVISGRCQSRAPVGMPQPEQNAPRYSSRPQQGQVWRRLPGSCASRAHPPVSRVIQAVPWPRVETSSPVSRRRCRAVRSARFEGRPSISRPHSAHQRPAAGRPQSGQRSRGVASCFGVGSAVDGGASTAEPVAARFPRAAAGRGLSDRLDVRVMRSPARSGRRSRPRRPR